MKKQKVLVLFAIALLLGVVVGGVQTVAAVMDESTYTAAIEQPIDVAKIQFVGNPVDGQWTKGTKFAGRPMEIMYWEKGTKYLIDIHLNDSGYIQNVSFRRWGLEVAEIPSALANQSIAKLFPDLVTPEISKSDFISESEYKMLMNANCTIGLKNIRFTGNAAHQEWIKGSTMNTNTLMYWDKYKKLAIILTLDSNGDVRTVDFSVNGKRAVREIPWAPANQSLAKLNGGVNCHLP